ncbi:hypothetical protein LINGRAHAP2_LOCUS10538 [Linum grandiflorum]
MDFRRIHDFNLALLGKQGRKLFTDPKALVSHLYKAKYYHNGDFLNSTLAHRPSYAWQSILSSQEIIKSGFDGALVTGDPLMC